MLTVRKYAPDTSVPVLLNGDEVVQGSSEIIDYLEQKYTSQPLTPSDVDERQLCLNIERTMDIKLGENIRQVLYSQILAYPDYIRYCFTQPMSKPKQLIFRLLYPILRNKIYQTYVISPERVEQARIEFDVAMEEIAKRINGNKYLVGEKFSRADITVASMLSFLAVPAEHPFPWIEMPDPHARAFCDEYRDHPAIVWVREIYRKHR